MLLLAALAAVSATETAALLTAAAAMLTAAAGAWASLKKPREKP